MARLFRLVARLAGPARSLPARFGPLIAVAAASLTAGPAAGQTTYYWNNSSTSGNWNTTTANWGANTTSSYTSPWSNGTGGNGAYFLPSNPNSTITLADAISLSQLYSSGNGITINSGAGGSLTLAGSNPTIYSYANTTINAALGGTNGLTKSGSGTLFLNGANTYTGTTAVNQGAVLYGSTGAVSGTGRTVAANSGGVVGTSYALDQAFLDRVTTTSAGVVGLTANSSASLDFSAFTGGLRLGAVNGNYTYSGAMTPAADNAYRFGGGNGYSLTVSSNLSGAGNKLDVGLGGTTSTNGAVVLTGTNTYTGGTTVGGGTLLFNAAGALPSSGAVTVNSGGTVAASTAAGGIASLLPRIATTSAGTVALTADSSANLDFSAFTGGLSLGAVNNSYTYSGTLTPAGNTYRLGGGGGSLTVSSALTDNGATARSLVVGGSGSSGNVFLTGANTFTGGTTVTQGTLYVGNGGATGSLTGNVAIGSSGALSFHRTDATSFAGNISGAGYLFKDGAGTLTLSGDNSGHTGQTYVYNGTLTAGSETAFGPANGSGYLYVNGGATVNLNGYAASFGNVSNYGTVTNTGSAVTLTVGTGNTSAYLSGALSGNIALNKVGTGTATILGTQTYNGGTTVNAGTALFNVATAVPATGTITVNSGGIAATGYALDQAFLGKVATTSAGSVGLGANSANNLDFSAFTGGLSFAAANGSYTYSGTLTPAADNAYRLTGGYGYNLTVSSALTDNGATARSLVVDGPTGYSGTVTLTGANTFTGGTAVNRGTLSVGNGGTTGTLAGNVAVASGAYLRFNRSDASTYAGNVSGAGYLYKDGVGTLTLSGANTHTGGTNVNGGTLAAGSGTAFGPAGGTGSGYLYVNTGATADLNGYAAGLGQIYSNGTVTNGSATAATLTVGNGNNSTYFYGAVSGNLSLVKVGYGSAYVYGTVAPTGGTTVNQGTLYVGYNGTTGTLAGNVAVASGAAVAFYRSDDSSYAGNVSGAGTLYKDGAGQLTLSGDNSGHTGQTYVYNGTLTAGSSTAFGPANGSGYLYVNGGATLDLNGNAAAFGTLQNSGTVTNSSGTTASLTVGNGTTSQTLSGAVTGNLALVKAGTGTLTVSTAKTYTGGTTISGGTLTLGAADVLPDTGTVTLAGGTLSTRSGRSDTIGTLAVTADSTIALGGSVHTLTIAGITGTPTGTLTITGWQGTPEQSGTRGHLVFASVGTDPFGFLAHVQFSGFQLGQAGFIQVSGGYELVPTPEPASVLGIAAAGFGLAGWARRRRVAVGV